jgi:hypothetical protein
MSPKAVSVGVVFVAALAVACGGSTGGSSGSSGASSSGSSGASSSGSSGTSSSGSSGTSSGDPQCADCGQCGIAGPVNQDAISTVAVGVDAQGVAAVGLRLERAGTCRGDPSAAAYVLRYAAGAATLAPRDASETIATTGVSYAGEWYTWSDRDLRMKLTVAVTGDVTFTFEAPTAGTSLDTKCVIAGAAITCS